MELLYSVVVIVDISSKCRFELAQYICTFSYEVKI